MGRVLSGSTVFNAKFVKTQRKESLTLIVVLIDQVRLLSEYSEHVLSLVSGQ